MAIEHACIRAVRKPWGSIDLRPWMRNDGVAIGELWFQRPDINAPDPALLLKLLFTTEPLSIQVHPDDAFAQSIGLERGKTEAWYILSATPSAKTLKVVLSALVLVRRGDRVDLETAGIEGPAKAANEATRIRNQYLRGLEWFSDWTKHAIDAQRAPVHSSSCGALLRLCEAICDYADCLAS